MTVRLRELRHRESEVLFCVQEEHHHAGPCVEVVGAVLESVPADRCDVLEAILAIQGSSSDKQRQQELKGMYSVDSLQEPPR